MSDMKKPLLGCVVGEAWSKWRSSLVGVHRPVVEIARIDMGSAKIEVHRCSPTKEGYVRHEEADPW